MEFLAGPGQLGVAGATGLPDLRLGGAPLLDALASVLRGARGARDHPLCGIPSEPSLGLVIQRLQELGVPHVVFNQRHFPQVDGPSDCRERHGRRGGLRLDGDRHRLEDFTAVYTRLMDYRLLPEVEPLPAN